MNEVPRHDVERDINFQAYQEAVESEKFADLDPETWIAYNNGIFVGSSKDQQELIESLQRQGLENNFVTQLGAKNKVFRLPFRLRK